MAPFWGRLAERYGMKLMVQRTMIAMVAHWLLMLLVTNVWHLLALRIMLGAFSGFGTMSIALVTHGAPRQQAASAIGTLQAVQILSAATGPFVGGILYDTVGLRTTFAVTAGLCLLGLVLISAVYSDTRHTEPHSVPAASGGEPGGEALEGGPAGERIGFRTVLRSGGILPIMAILFWATVISRSFSLVVPLFVKEIAAGSPALGLINGLTVSLGSFAEALSAFVMGRLSARTSPRRLLLAGLITSMVVVLPMPFVHDAWQFALLRILLGIAAGGALTLGYTMGGALFPERGRAVYYSVLSSGAMLGGALGPTLCGGVSWLAGIRYNFALAAAVYAALALLSLSGLLRDTADASRAADDPPARRPYIPVPR
jgi:MFS family permease